MAFTGSGRALHQDAEAFFKPVQDLLLLIVVFERKEKLAVIGHVMPVIDDREGHGVHCGFRRLRRRAGALIRDQRTYEWRQLVPGHDGFRRFLSVIYPEMAGALPNENYRSVINSRDWRYRRLRDRRALVKISLLNWGRAQQSGDGRGDAAHLIVVPDLGRRVAAVYFCGVLQELILVGI